MFISSITNDILLMDASGEAFIPTSGIAYVDAFYAFLDLETTWRNHAFEHKKLCSSSHDRLILWLNESIIGKFYCPLFRYKSRAGYICFELEQDAVLFKLTFS